jgi:hypothetical protein
MRVAVAAALAGAALAAVPADRVATLPGFGTPLTALYSGYLDAGAGKHHHYVYSESRNNPATDDLVIWFNGSWRLSGRAPLDARAYRARSARRARLLGTRRSTRALTGRLPLDARAYRARAAQRARRPLTHLLRPSLPAQRRRARLLVARGRLQ